MMTQIIGRASSPAGDAADPGYEAAGERQESASQPFSHQKIARALFCADVLGFALLFCLVFWWTNNGNFIGSGVFFSHLIGSSCVSVLVFYIFDLYRPSSVILGIRAPARTLIATFLSAGLGVIQIRFFSNDTKLLVGALIFFLLFMAYASALRFFIYRWVLAQLERMKWLVIGSHDCFSHFWKEYKARDAQGEIVYLSRFDEPKPDQFGWPWQGTHGDLENWLQKDWSGIILATDGQLPNDIIEKLMQVRLKGTRVYDLTDYYERFWFKVPVFYLKNGWFAISHGFDLLHNPMTLRLKRLVDLTLAFGLLLLSLPLLPLIVLLIKVDSSGSVFYKQERTGENGKSFDLYKFRTMFSDAEKNGAKWASQFDNRVTRVGKFLRLTRIDEIPQLWNVFRGDMSFIGPRPERPFFNSQLEKEIPFYDLRHLIKPGITGWAQVLYKYGASVADAKEKLQYDLYYIKNCSMLLDLAIVFKTFRVILLGKGR